MKLQKTYLPLIIFSLILPLLGSIISITLLQDWKYEYELAHSILEVLGSLFALTILVFVFSGQTTLSLEKREVIWITTALGCMALFDMFHAVSDIGNNFVWYHSIATFSGGFLFACIWWRRSDKQNIEFIRYIVIAMAFGLALWANIFPEQVPVMISDGGFSHLARLLNITGGIGFIAAFVYFLKKHKTTGRKSHNLLAMHCLLFGMAGLLFEYSALWDAAWWWWHILRFVAYIVLMTFFFEEAFNKMDRATKPEVNTSTIPASGASNGTPFIVLLTGLISILLGSSVITGWYVHSYDLIQILPQFAPMQYNTALGFLLSGIALLAALREKRDLVFVSAGTVGLMALLTLLQYLFQIDLSIDQLLMDAYITVKTSHPGRMAPNTALCFILTSIALILYSFKELHKYAFIIAEILGLMILALSAMALTGYIVSEESGYGWGVLTRMALHTTAGFIVLGFGILHVIWRSQTQSIASVPLWFPALLCFGVLLFDMLYPKGVAAGVAYVPLVFCALFFYGTRLTFVFAGLATLLTVLGYLASSDVGVYKDNIIINRLLSIMAIWITAAVVYLQKTTQMKLQASEESMQLGWRGAGDGMWDWNILSNQVVFSDRFKELLGYGTEEIPNRFDEWANRLHADDKEKVFAVLDAHLKTKTSYDVEFRMQTKSGNWRWFQAKGQALWDATGAPIRMAGSLSDITSRLESESQLRLLKLVIENSKDLVVVTKADPDNPVIIFVNKASQAICGYAPEEMLGQTPKILQGDKTDRAQLDALKVALNKGDSFSTELINYSKDGRAYWIEINIVPVKDEVGRTTHFAAIERDITERKEADIERERLITALENSNKELDEFAYVASHDLKAPLRVIDNASRWLEEDLAEHLDDESKENIQLLRSRVVRMERLLDDLLEYSRIGRKLNGQNEEIISGEVLMNDVALLLSLPNDFSINIKPEFKQLKFNRMPLQHILLNLISNAIKHHDKKSGKIDLDVEDIGDNYKFTVKDDGPGIPKQYHEKIFKMFQTLKPRDRVEGSGMGLAMVRKHIELLGGTISLESDQEQGCTFSFIWPKQQLIN